MTNPDSSAPVVVDLSPKPGVAEQQPLISGKDRAFMLVGVVVAMLFAALDQTVVGTAMPRIVADLGGLQHYAWVFTAYMLASSVTVPIYGKLSDMYGRRPFFLLGTGLFLLGSLASPLSQDMMQLVLARVLQGLGAGALMALGPAIVGDIFPPAERGKWQGLIAAVAGLVMLFGPTAGGYVTDNWGWRWIFYINLPLGLVGLVLSWLSLPRFRPNIQRKVDVLGGGLLVAGMVPLLLALSWAGTDYAWSSPVTIGLLVTAVVLLGMMCVVELRVSEPIIDLRLFRNDIFRLTMVSIFLLNVALYGGIMFLPLFVQSAMGQSATDSGTVLMPMMLAFVISAIISGQIASRTQRYRVLVVVMFCIGGLGMWLFSQMEPSVTKGVVMRNMVVTGLGLGGLSSIFMIVVQNALPKERLGEVTASVQFYRTLAGTIGIAVLGAVLTNSFRTRILANLPAELTRQLSPEALDALTSPQALMGAEGAAASASPLAALGQGQMAGLVDVLRLSLSEAVSSIFLISTGVLGAGLLAAVFLREIPLRKTNKWQKEEDAAPAAAGVAPAVAEQEEVPASSKQVG